ncbi:MAG: DUF2478 domain-containing protein [Paracoccaceae bacterium]|nr:DUF2478 domain-containing protein [Paracoccaceae bacterium]
MLAYVQGAGRGQADRLLWDLAARLRGMGWPLAGAVQINIEFDPERPCDMDLHVLDGREVVRISQNLGPLSKGCRLDAAGLEQVVGLAERALQGMPRLLIVNKFGKQEIDGRGFRPIIGQALAMGIPVLTSVNSGNLSGFEAFAEGMATALPPEMDAVLGWCLAQDVRA